MKVYKGILKNNHLIDILESVRGEYYAHLKSPKETYASVYHIEHDTYNAWNLHDVATSVYRKLIRQLDKDSFAVMPMHITCESFRRPCLLTELDSSLIYTGDACVGAKFYKMFERREQLVFFKETRFINFRKETIHGHQIGIMILFKNKADQVLTELTDCFEVLK